MEISEILELVRAGYTKSEIEQLASMPPAEQPEEQPAEQPEEQPAGQPEKQPVEQPADNNDKRFDAIETRLTHIINKMNYDAVKNSRQPEQPKETVDDILASMISGKSKEE